MAPAADWYEDPLGRYELRYWDGDQWTEHVAAGGEQLVDPRPIVVESEDDDATDDRAADDEAVDTGADDAQVDVDETDDADSVAAGSVAGDGDDGDRDDGSTDEHGWGVGVGGAATSETVASDDAASDTSAAEDDTTRTAAAATEEPPASDEPDVVSAPPPAAEDRLDAPATDDAPAADGLAVDDRADAAPVVDGTEAPAVDGDGAATVDGTAASRAQGATGAAAAAAPGLGPTGDVATPPADAPPTTAPPVAQQPAATPAVAPATPAPAADTSGRDLGPDGIGGGLLDDAAYAERSGERVLLQNPRMLKVTLGRDVMIKRGSMIAYQGDMAFHYESEGGGIGGLLKRAVASDNAKMARVSGTGDLFLADDAYEVHMLELDGGGLVVNGPNLLAFEEGMSFATRSLGNAGVVAGGVFVTDVSGHGWVAVTCHGTPVRLDTDVPTYVDAQSAVAWSSSLQVDLNVQKLSIKSMRSGEVAQLAFRGEGFVLVQASEGPAVPEHGH